MPNNYRMSYFMPPIAPIKDKQGRLMTPLLFICKRMRSNHYKKSMYFYALLSKVGVFFIDFV